MNEKEVMNIDVYVNKFLNTVSQRLKKEGIVSIGDFHLEYCRKVSSKQMKKTQVKARHKI